MRIGLLGWSALALAGGVAGALAVGALWPRRPVRRAPGGSKRLILLRTNSLHTDVGIPATPLVRRRFAFLKDVGIPVDDPALTHILVGWGAEGFYPNNAQPQKIGPLALLHAVLGDDSVLRFAALAEPKGQWSGREVHEISDDALEALVAFVERTLERDEAGAFKCLDHPGIIELDHFYEARPTFALVACCNVWVSEALAETGIANGRWTPLPQTLSASIEYHRG